MPFGSVNERKAEFLSREVDCPFVDKSSQNNPMPGKYEPIGKKLVNVSSSTALSQDSSFISTVPMGAKQYSKVHKGSSLGRLQTLDEVEEGDNMRHSVDATKTSLLKYATKEPARPGPGHYQLDLPDQIK